MSFSSFMVTGNLEQTGFDRSQQSAVEQVGGEINTQEPSETPTEREKLSHTVEVHSYNHKQLN